MNYKEKQKNVPLWQKILRTSALAFILIVLILGVFIPPVIHYGRKQEALAILGQAKNVEITLRMLSLDYYGQGISIFSPQKANGMTDEAEAKVREMAMVDGQVILLEWDSDRMRALNFLYTEGDYTVRFSYDVTEEQSSWDVYRSKKVLEFGK